MNRPTASPAIEVVGDVAFCTICSKDWPVAAVAVAARSASGPTGADGGQSQ